MIVIRQVKQKKRPAQGRAHSLSKNPKSAVSARKQRFAGLRGKCCGTRLRGSAPITPAGTVGEWVSSGHNRRRRLATRRCDTKRAGTTAVVPATIEWQQCLLHLHFFDTLSAPRRAGRRQLPCYSVPVTVSVLAPGVVVQTPVVGSCVYVAAGTVTFPATVANWPVAAS